MVWPLVFAAAASIGSAIIGANEKSKARRDAQRTRQGILQRIDALEVPDPEKERLALEEFKTQGVLEPEIEEVFTASDTELENIITDPRLKEAQFGGIEALTKIAEGEGFNDQDRARFEQARQQSGLEARGRREASEQNLRRRGLGGSGLEVQAALDAENAAAERLGSEGLNIAGAGSERALNAILQRSQLGTQVRGQEYGEQADAAKAQDVIGRFNVGQRSNAEQRRVDAANRAAAANLQQSQLTADKNVNTANQQQIHNKGLAGKQYDRKLQKEAIAGGASQQIAKGQQQAGQDAADTASGISKGIGQVASAYYNKK